MMEMVPLLPFPQLMALVLMVASTLWLMVCTAVYRGGGEEVYGAESEKRRVTNMLTEIAYQMGLPIPMDNVIFSGSHSHSGPGAISASFLWELAPATDLLGIY